MHLVIAHKPRQKRDEKNKDYGSRKRVRKAPKRTGATGYGGIDFHTRHSNRFLRGFYISFSVWQFRQLLKGDRHASNQRVPRE